MRTDIEHKDWNYFVSGVPELCQETQDYCSELKTELGSNYDKDVRYLMLNAMQNEYASSLWIIGGSMMITNSDEQVREFYKLVDQTGDNTLVQVTYTDFVRKSVVTRLYFLLDHFLSCLSEHLTGASQRQVYGNAKSVQTSLSLDESDIDVFSALGFTRNSFHNNGIHKGRTQTFSVDARTFDFTDGQEISLNWDDIKILIHSAIRTTISWGKSIPSNTLVQNL